MGKKLPGKFAGRKFQALDTGGNQGDGRRARARPEGEGINRPVTHSKKLKKEKPWGKLIFEILFHIKKLHEFKIESQRL